MRNWDRIAGPDPDQNRVSDNEKVDRRNLINQRAADELLKSHQKIFEKFQRKA